MCMYDHQPLIGNHFKTFANSFEENRISQPSKNLLWTLNMAYYSTNAADIEKYTNSVKLMR